MFDDLSRRQEQFVSQAQWTGSIRRYLTECCRITPDQCCLEVGCGTGVILLDWEQHYHPAFGIDLHYQSLRMAASHVKSPLTAADAIHLPYSDNTFDCIFSHYFFLWAKHPLDVLNEIMRCMKPGGWLLVFAEPDYGGRIDFPPSLEVAKDIQISGLRNQGADPFMGRKMQSLLQKSGFRSISGGILASEWQTPETAPDQDNIDRKNLIHDLSFSDMDIDASQLAAWDQKARQQGTRIAYVPTFYFRAQK